MLRVQAEANPERVVVVYERVSTEKQDIARQEVQRDRAAQQYPDREVVVLQDDGVSAYKIPIFDRRGGKELCRRVEEGRVEAIFADAQDRLSRGRQSEWWNFVDLCEQNATRIFIDGRELRLGEEGDEIKSAIDAIIARRESRQRSHRVRGGKRRAAESGRRNGGPRPFGYRHASLVVDGRPTSRLEPVEREAEAVERMFDGYMRGKSQAEIARDLNNAGVTTTTGARWSQSMVGQVLRNPLYRGKVTYRGEVFDGKHEPLVSDDLWFGVEAVRIEAVRRRGNGGGRPPKGRHLLTGGLLRCSCGAAMRARTQSKHYGTWEAYICDGRHSGRTNCTAPAIGREEIDAAVWTYFETIGLDYEAMIREEAERRDVELTDLARRIADADREVATAAAQLERVERDYLSGDLSAATYERLLERCQGELAAATAARNQLQSREAELETLSALADAEEATRTALREIRDTLSGLVTGAGDLPAARAALRRLFESFTLYRYESAPDVLDADLAAAEWYLVPMLREDAILVPLVIGRDSTGEPVVEQQQQLHRVPRKPSGSPR